MLYSAEKRRKTILIVEDEESLREILQDELTAIGYKVAVARNGVEGLARLQDIEPDLIICDRNMPSMNGYELLERIRGVYPQYRTLPFIFLTALTDAADKQAVGPLRPTAYLEKPLDFDLLRATIEKAFAPKNFPPI
jgi:CheY-like chemotaxis protein